MKPGQNGKKLTRREFVIQLGAGSVGVAAAARAMASSVPSHSGVVLENKTLRVVLDRRTGMLAQINNLHTGETVAVHGDEFAVIADEFKLTPPKFSQPSIKKLSARQAEVTYRSDGRTVKATYKLGEGSGFLEKHLSIFSNSAYRLKRVTVSDLRLSGPAIQFVEYPYQKNVVYFARSPKGGLFLGLELPFDSSSLSADKTVSLGYKASLKVGAGQHFNSEAVFLGVYARNAADVEKPDLPLSSESEAMLAMTSAILGPPRHQELVGMANGWWSEMQHETYKTEAQVEADMRSLDFLEECGVNWVSDSHPWSGEIAKINALGPGDRYAPGPLVTKFLEYARKKKLKIVFWPTMTNTDPWWKGMGKPFRSDRPDWVMFPGGKTVRGAFATGLKISEHVEGNCIANEPFWQWLMGIQQDGMKTGYFDGWVMDGDFFGGGGVVVPVDCPSSGHDHLPGDSNYACERSLDKMVARIREDYPDTLIGPMCRPAMDLGIWSNRNADSIFTLDEMAEVEPLPGLNSSPVNVMYGDKIRKWSRIRVHYNFTPHYMDAPQVFVAPRSMAVDLKLKQMDWPSAKIDYVMLSGLSSAPTLLFYLPTKAGIPARDKAEIRRWMEWGEKNIRYLQVRKDLPQWPEAGKVDGSAHIIKDRGLVCLFNPNPHPLETRFRLDKESIGLTEGTRFDVSQSYPSGGKARRFHLGQEVAWEVPAETSLVLDIRPATV